MRAGNAIRSSGFTYMAVLHVIVCMAIASMKLTTVYQTSLQREHEAELLSIGEAFQKAIGSFYENSPGTIKRYPTTLDDLLLDDRFLSMVRHLRKIDMDPFTKQALWGIVSSNDGGIMGVYSLSDNVPLKQAGFKTVYGDFVNASTYQDWKFVYVPKETGVR